MRKVPLLILLILSSLSSLCQQADGDSNVTFLFNGNTIEAKVLVDTLYFRAPGTKEYSYKIKPPDTIPYRVNGKRAVDITNHIGGMAGVTLPKVVGTNGLLSDWLTKYFINDINYLQRLGYEIRVRNVVIDERGHVAYYYARVCKQWNFKNTENIDAQRVKDINKRVADSLSKVKLMPTAVNGLQTAILIKDVLGFGFTF
jgi:hypothetical protein